MVSIPAKTLAADQNDLKPIMGRTILLIARTGPMLGFKVFDNAAITIAGVELQHRIRKGQFALGPLRVQGRSASDLAASMPRRGSA